MNDGVRNLMEFTGVPLEEVWRTTSFNQAIALGIDNKKVVLKWARMLI